MCGDEVSAALAARTAVHTGKLEPACRCVELGVGVGAPVEHGPFARRTVGLERRRNRRAGTVGTRGVALGSGKSVDSVAADVSLFGVFVLFGRRRRGPSLAAVSAVTADPARFISSVTPNYRCAPNARPLPSRRGACLPRSVAAANTSECLLTRGRGLPRAGGSQAIRAPP